MPNAPRNSATTHACSTAAHDPIVKRATQQLAEETRLLLTHLARHLGKIARVLHPIIHAIPIHIREIVALTLSPLLKIAA